MSSALIGCLVGALLSGKWSDRYGRKKMLIMAAFLFILSAVETGATSDFNWFIIYRIIVAVLALVVIWDIVRERSLAHVMSLGIICFPLILRALLIK